MHVRQLNDHKNFISYLGWKTKGVFMSVAPMSQ